MGKRGDSGIDKDLLSFVTGLDVTESATLRSKNDTLTIYNNKTMAESTEKVSVADLTAVLGDETGFANLKKRIDVIAQAEDAAENKTKSSVEIVAAPLANYEKQKLERKAAYELSSKEANKWIPVIRANRNAKTLSFPAKDSSGSQFEVGEALTVDFAPRNTLEEEIQALLKKSGMDSEEGLITTEKMELGKLTPEEVERRYEELSKHRALLFYSEQKAKRQAKIKSKAFRKVVKREKERRIIKDAEASGETLTEEEMREERMKAEICRIKERMTLKTRKASKWAHDLMQKRRLESGSREEVMQQVRDKDRLRQEILGKAAQLGGDLDDDLDDGLDGGLGSSNVDNDYEDESSASDGDTSKVVKGNATVKKRRDEDDYEDDGGDVSFDEKVENEVDEIFESMDQPKSSSSTVIGRRVFNPKNPINKADEECPKSSVNIFGKAIPAEEEEERKSIIRPTKQTKKKTRADIQNLFVAEDEEAITMDEKTKSQLEMIRQAFEGDQVFSEFQEMKQAEIDEDKPKDIDLTLPGWGSWGGAGIEETPKWKVFLKGKDGIDPKKRKDANLNHVIIHEKRSRKMAKLMVEKQPFPFKTPEEYERSLLSKPTGKEWNSATAFTKSIKPRVQVKVGSIIEPIKFVKKDYSGENLSV